MTDPNVPGTPGPIRVLVVEDDPTLGRLIELTLSGQAEVTLVNRGLPAIETAKAEEFDAVASDISLPDLSGMEVIAQIREMAPDAGIVAMTGFVDVETAVQSMKAGADDFLGKPFDPQVLWHVLNKAMDNRKQRREAEQAAAYRTLAYTDALTGAKNRRFFDEYLVAAVSDSRATREPLTVAFLDIDNFKLLNDFVGHEEGDDVLRQVSTALSETLTDPNVFARFGGDEFVAAFPGMGPRAASLLMDAFRARLGSIEVRNNERNAVPLRISAGFSELREGQSPRDLIGAAEDAMYLDKSMAPGLLAHQMMQRDLTVEDRTAANVASLQALRGLVKAIDRRDSYTRFHSDHATRMALDMAARLGLDDDQVNAIALGGPIHDLGKIVVPDEILQKPGPLTADERRMMDLHPVMGAAITAAAMDYDTVVDLVRHHHERFDGNGYPGGVVGEAISFTTRLFTLADAFSAMTTDRPYRKGLSEAAAYEQMLLGAGTQFDPDLAKEFVAMLQEQEAARRLSA
ncbi:MAG: diguanylate cyclase [Tepidiformaceae bacterium]